MNITRFPPAESGTSINEQPKTVGKQGTNTGDGGRGNGCAESQASPVFDGGIEWMPRGFIMLLSVGSICSACSMCSAFLCVCLNPERLGNAVTRTHVKPARLRSGKAIGIS